MSLVVPPGLSYLPYQREGVHWLLQRQNALLADEMGLGKTVQACGLINNDCRIRSTLIICPAILKVNWQRELRKWCLMCDCGIAAGSTWPCTNTVIINYDILKRHHDALRAKEWGLIVIDEAHKLKNPKSQRTQQVMGSAKITPIPSWRKVLMTGTPIVNRPIEIFPLLQYLAPQQWNNVHQFGMRYCGGGGKALIRHFGGPLNSLNWRGYCEAAGVLPKPCADLNLYREFKAKYQPRGMRVKELPDYQGATNLDELRGHLRGGVMLRRLKAEVENDLPPKFHQVVELDAGARAKRLVLKERELWREMLGDDAADKLTDPQYQSVVDGLEGGGGCPEMEALSLLRRELGEIKLPMVVEHLRECIASVGKIVCFCHHREFAQGLLSAFGAAAVRVVGGISDTERQRAIDSFQGDDSVRLIICSKAGAEGLNLTASSFVVMAEQFYVPGLINQMVDRCHRHGQKFQVICQHLMLAGSMDVDIAKKAVGKQRNISQAIDG